MSHPDRIDPEIAYEYFTEGRVAFVDARPASAFARARFQLPDAVHIPTGSGAEIVAGLRSLPYGNNVPVVVYCDEPNEAASYQVATYAKQLGFEDVSVLTGGFEAWADAALPFEPTPHASVVEWPPELSPSPF